MFDQDVRTALDSIQAEVELLRESQEAGTLNRAEVEAGLSFIRRQCQAIKEATRLQSRVEDEEEAVAA